MKAWFASALLATALASITGCASTPGGVVTGTRADDPAVQQVAQALAGYSASVRAMDSERIVATFEEDGALLGPGVQGIKGRDAIRAYLASMAGARVVDAEFHIAATRLEGDVATQDGEFEQRLQTPDGETVRAHGDFQAVWDRSQAGEWRLRFVYSAPVVDDRS